jgi:DNA-binding NarL/FixJ family response regulator
MKILIVDDHPVVRRGLKQILSEEPDFRSFGEASNAFEAIEKVNEQDWDAVILDLNLPDGNGLHVLSELKNICPKLPVLILSIQSEDQIAISVLKSDASGYLNKDSAPEELVKAVRKVIEGGKYISTSVAEKLAISLRTGFEKPHEILSDREYQVMCMISSGKNIKEIAKELYLSTRTIRTYRARILEKMKMKSNTAIIHYAIKNRLVNLLLLLPFLF